MTATVALFVALGGTGYAAITLPRDSVGSEEIRARAVGPSELRSRSVNSRVIRVRSIRLRDISTGARNALRGRQGPQGPAGAPATTLRAAVSSGGGAAAGNARSVEHLSGSNEYRIDFGRDLTGCIYTATLAAVQSGPTWSSRRPAASPWRPTARVSSCGHSAPAATPSSNPST